MISQCQKVKKFQMDKCKQTEEPHPRLNFLSSPTNGIPSQYSRSVRVICPGKLYSAETTIGVCVK